jgi:hypothetical protein
MSKSPLSRWMYLLLASPFILAFISVYANWIKVKDEFYAITLVDLLDFFATAAFGVFLGTLLAYRVGRTQRRTELVCAMWDRLQQLIDTSFQASEHYMRDSSDENRRRVLRLFKESSSYLNAIGECSEESNAEYSIDTAHFSLLLFKRAATDSPFGESAPVFESRHYSNLHDRYCSLVNLIWKKKTQLFR